MSLSAKSLHAAGRISDKQMAKLSVLKGTRSQKSKMAPFESKTKGEGARGDKGIAATAKGQINGSAGQDKGGTFGMGGRRAPPSKGGRAGPEGQVGRGQISKGSMQRPNWPAKGSSMSKKNPLTGNTKMKGKIPATGGWYGGGGRGTQ